MAKYNIIFIDKETGGLNCEKNPVTEVGFIIDNPTTREHVIGEVEMKVQPYDKSLIYDAKATEITGLTIEILEERGFPIKDVVEMMIDCFKQAKVGRRKPILCGHNIPFDIGFLLAMFDFCNKKPQDCLEGVVHKGNFVPAYVDTLDLAKLMWEGVKPKLKLGHCCQYAGIELMGAHSAMQDIKATRELYYFFRDIMRGKNASPESTVLDGGDKRFQIG